MTRNVALAVLSMVLLAGVGFARPAAADDEATMMQEIQQLASEKKANEAKMQTNLVRQDSVRKVIQLDAEAQKLKAERDHTESDLCARWRCVPAAGPGQQGTVYCDGDSSCESLRTTHNATDARYQAAWKAAQAAYDAGEKQDKAYAALEARNQEIDARIRSLKLRIKALKASGYAKAYAECVRGAAGIGNLDTSVQEYNHCLDDAGRASSLPTVEQETARVWVDPQARAREAIDRYLKSGQTRPGPQSFHPVVPPVPELVLQQQQPSPKK